MRIGSKRAFTLVEVLAVIAIIVSLLAILFPAFADSLGLAKRTNCQSNLFNIGVATQLYLGDNNDVYPETVNYVDRYMPGVLSGLPRGLDPRNYETPVQALSAYVSSSIIWRCPEDTGWKNQRYGVQFYPALWKWNGGTSYFFSELFLGQTSTSLGDLSSKVWASDAGPNWHGAPVPLNEGVFFYDLLFFDGHVKYGQGLPYIDFNQIKGK